MSKAKPVEVKRYDAKSSEVKVEIPKETETEKYFKKLPINKQSLDKANKEILSGEKKIIKSIYKEKLEVKQSPTDINMLLIKEEINEQEQKAEQLKKKRDELIKAIQKLDMRMNRESESYKTIAKQYNSPDQLKYKPNSIFTKEEHEALVQKIKNAQQIQDQRNQERLYRLQKKLQQEQQKIKKMDEEKLNSDKELRRRRSQYNLTLRKQINELQNAQQARAKKQLSQLRKKSFLHQILQQKFNNKVIAPNLEEKKKKLKQIRQISRTFKVKDIDQHERKYLKERNNSMHLIQSKAKIADEWKYVAPQKPEKLVKYLEDQITNKKKQLQKSKKQIEQKILRKQNYVRTLKQKCKITVDQQKQKQLARRIGNIHTERREPTQKQLQQAKDYLNLAKKMGRKMSASQIKETEQQYFQQSPRYQSSRVNYLKTKQSGQYYSEKRNQKLQKIIQSDKDTRQKTHQLQLQNKKLQEAYQRKQQLLKIKGGTINTRSDAAQLLLSGIQAKMGLIKLAN